MRRSNESGSHMVILAFAVLVVGVLAFAGYRVYQMQQAANGTPLTTAATNTVAPATVTNTATLKQAGSALDAAAIQLNSNLDDSSLNASLNSML